MVECEILIDFCHLLLAIELAIKRAMTDKNLPKQLPKF